jgi:hypothetical protein
MGVEGDRFIKLARSNADIGETGLTGASLSLSSLADGLRRQCKAMDEPPVTNDSVTGGSEM